jgi:hypothetical protein
LAAVEVGRPLGTLLADLLRGALRRGA